MEKPKPHRKRLSKGFLSIRRTYELKGVLSFEKVSEPKKNRTRYSE